MKNSLGLFNSSFKSLKLNRIFTEPLESVGPLYTRLLHILSYVLRCRNCVYMHVACIQVAESFLQKEKIIMEWHHTSVLWEHDLTQQYFEG